MTNRLKYNKSIAQKKWEAENISSQYIRNHIINLQHKKKILDERINIWRKRLEDRGDYVPSLVKNCKECGIDISELNGNRLYCDVCL